MEIKMTREEFYAKYGDVEVTFNSYYKYTFEYIAELPDGKILSVEYGGNSSDIYRHEVYAISCIKVSQLEPNKGAVYKDGKEVEGFYDY